MPLRILLKDSFEGFSKGLFEELFEESSRLGCDCIQIGAADSRDPKDFDKCAVDFVALIRHCTQTLVVEGLAGSRYGLSFQNHCPGFDGCRLPLCLEVLLV